MIARKSLARKSLISPFNGKLGPLLILPSLALWASIAHAQAPPVTFLVNPAGGADIPGGNLNGEYSTLTFALNFAQQTVAPTTGLVFRLSPGTYSESTNGEVFPINLRENSVVEGTSPTGVLFLNSSPPSLAVPTIQCDLSAPQSYVELRNFSTTGVQTGIRVRGLGPSSEATLERLTTENSGGGGFAPTGIGSGIRTVAAGGILEVTVKAHTSRDLQIGLEVIANQGGFISATIENSRYNPAPTAVNASSGTGILLDTTSTSSIALRSANTSFFRKRDAIRTSINSPIPSATIIDHCVIRSCGINAFGPMGALVLGGGICEEANPSSFAIHNTAFFGNGADLPDANMLFYDIENCIAQDANVLAIATNSITGDPMWVNAFENDFHLLPGSPCLDAGTVPMTSLTSVDRDGDDRSASCAGLPDIGLDEQFDADFYFPGGNLLTLGTNEEVRLIGPSNSLGFVLVDITPPSEFTGCSGLLLDPTAPITFLVAALQMPAGVGGTATATTSIPIPNNPGLVGSTFFTTTAYFEVTTLTVLNGNTVRGLYIQ